MQIVRFFNIDWDTDDQDCHLPKEAIHLVDEDCDLEYDGTELLSDKYGFLVKGCHYKVLDDPHLSPQGWQLNDGGVIGYPDDAAEIRRTDQHGKLQEVRRPNDPNYAEWKRLFE